MASTSVHLPSDVVERLDLLAAARGVSRNRIILAACEALLDQQRGDWPQDLWDPGRLSAADLAELRDGGQALESAIYAARQDRPVPAL